MTGWSGLITQKLCTRRARFGFTSCGDYDPLTSATTCCRCGVQWHFLCGVVLGCHLKARYPNKVTKLIRKLGIIELDLLGAMANRRVHEHSKQHLLSPSRQAC